jgi:hypothetical protein
MRLKTGAVSGVCEHSKELSSSVKGGHFFD